MKLPSGILRPMADLDRSRESLLTALHHLCPTIEDDVLRDFVLRMDAEYFERFPPETIAHHIQLISQLTPDHPCELSVRPGRDQHIELSIVAYDYFSEFATICGLLSAFGLNIEEGRIYTFADVAALPARPA